jgi:hypothetical protein
VSDVRVRVSEEPWLDSIGVYILRGEDVLQILHFDRGWEIVPENVQPEATLRLRGEEARALLEALVRHYQGTEDTRMLRKDYDAERARVDKFIDSLVGRGSAP